MVAKRPKNKERTTINIHKEYRDKIKETGKEYNEFIRDALTSYEKENHDLELEYNNTLNEIEELKEKIISKKAIADNQRIELINKEMHRINNLRNIEVDKLKFARKFIHETQEIAIDDLLKIIKINENEIPIDNYFDNNENNKNLGSFNYFLTITIKHEIEFEKLQKHITSNVNFLNEKKKNKAAK